MSMSDVPLNTASNAPATASSVAGSTVPSGAVVVVVDEVVAFAPASRCSAVVWQRIVASTPVWSAGWTRPSGRSVAPSASNRPVGSTASQRVPPASKRR
jgi:hypothetical protein